MKKNLITVIIATVLVVIFALLLFTFQVRQSEVAVLDDVRQAGRRQH